MTVLGGAFADDVDVRLGAEAADGYEWHGWTLFLDATSGAPPRLPPSRADPCSDQNGSSSTTLLADSASGAPPRSRDRYPPTCCRSRSVRRNPHSPASPSPWWPFNALNGEEIRALLLTNVDLAHGTLTIRRGIRRRVVRLEPFTHQLIADWLTERHARWPASTNPHLLVTGRTALSTTAAPPDVTAIRGVFPKGMSLDVLRQDRILDEARSSLSARPLPAGSISVFFGCARKIPDLARRSSANRVREKEAASENRSSTAR
ncbi:hypothetical protein [Streptomyces sp. NPDC002346]